MFDTAPPDREAFRELQTLVHHLADELASFRRRAIGAEARLRELEGAGGGDAAAAGDPRQLRIDRLEAENAELRARLDAAAERVRQMHDRVRFLRQQTQQTQQGAAQSAAGGTER